MLNGKGRCGRRGRTGDLRSVSSPIDSVYDPGQSPWSFVPQVLHAEEERLFHPY